MAAVRIINRKPAQGRAVGRARAGARAGRVERTVPVHAPDQQIVVHGNMADVRMENG